MDKLIKNSIILDNKPTCQKLKVTFGTICTLFNDNLLHKPCYQTDLDEDKIKEMIVSYMKNPNYLLFKDTIVIAVTLDKNKNNKLYVVDGQHRLEMARKLFLNNDTNDYLTLCFVKIDTDDQMKDLFREINLDSYKNMNYVSLDELQVTLYDSCRNYLEEKYQMYFPNKKSITNTQYTISEFLDKLVEKDYFESVKDITMLIKDINSANNAFIKTVNYKDDFIKKPKIFYKNELKCVEHGIAFSLMRNNFIDYLVDRKIIPSHNYKMAKSKIPQKLRKKVWENEFGTLLEGICPVRKCETKISSELNGYHCGHIISEHNGGSLTEDNLRPICSSCNCRMGTNNWKVFEKNKNRKKK